MLPAARKSQGPPKNGLRAGSDWGCRGCRSRQRVRRDGEQRIGGRRGAFWPRRAAFQKTRPTAARAMHRRGLGKGGCGGRAAWGRLARGRHTSLNTASSCGLRLNGLRWDDEPPWCRRSGAVASTTPAGRAPPRPTLWKELLVGSVRRPAARAMTRAAAREGRWRVEFGEGVARGGEGLKS